MEIIEKWWKIMKNGEKLWKIVKNYGNKWKIIKTIDKELESTENNQRPR